MIGFLSFISKVNCTALPHLFIQVLLNRFSLARKDNIHVSRLALCLVRIALKLRRFWKPTFIVCKSGVGCTTYLTGKLISGVLYLTSISQVLTSQYLSAWTICVVYTSNWKSYCTLKKIILTLNKSLPLLLSVMGTTIIIEQYRSRISCHNNSVKAKDAFSHVRDQFWNMMFYLLINVFYLPTLKDVVGRYKL